MFGEELKVQELFPLLSAIREYWVSACAKKADFCYSQGTVRMIN